MADDIKTKKVDPERVKEAVRVMQQFTRTNPEHEAQQQALQDAIATERAAVPPVQADVSAGSLERAISPISRDLGKINVLAPALAQAAKYLPPETIAKMLPVAEKISRLGKVASAARLSPYAQVPLAVDDALRATGAYTAVAKHLFNQEDHAKNVAAIEEAKLRQQKEEEEKLRKLDEELQQSIARNE